MHPTEVLKSIYREHEHRTILMAETLVELEVPLADVDLLSRLPWPFLANRIAVERERLGLSAVQPLFHWKLPPPPPTWLTPAVVVKIFELALSEECDEGADPTPAHDRALFYPLKFGLPRNSLN